MFVIPFQISETEYSVFICLQDDNIERLRAYDPAEVTMDKVRQQMQGVTVHGPAVDSISEGRTLRDIIIGWATEADLAHVSEMMAARAGIHEVLRYLARGYRFRPDAGDHDGPYLSMKPNKGPVQ